MRIICQPIGYHKLKHHEENRCQNHHTQKTALKRFRYSVSLRISNKSCHHNLHGVSKTQGNHEKRNVDQSSVSDGIIFQLAQMRKESHVCNEHQRLYEIPNNQGEGHSHDAAIIYVECFLHL